MSAKLWERGDIGPDSRVFWKYDKKCKNGELWITQEKYQESREKVSERNRKYHKANYEANREKILVRNRKYREANREKISEIQRKCYEANREKYLESNRKYHEANREKVLERKRKYHEANREKISERERKCRRQKAADQFFVMAGAVEDLKKTMKKHE